MSHNNSHYFLGTISAGGAGGTVVTHVSHHCDQSLIPDLCGYLIKVTLVTHEKSVVQFDSTKHCRFSPGVPVLSYSNPGPEWWPLLDLLGEQLMYLIGLSRINKDNLPLPYCIVC